MTKSKNTPTIRPSDGIARPHYEVMQVCLEASEPCVAVGDPGQAKTAVTHAVAQERNWVIKPLMLSILEPQDVMGFPSVENGVTIYNPPAWAAELAACDNGILFLDELSTASPAMQKPALRIVHERIVGDLELGRKVRIIAAMNPPDSGVGALDLPPALANRFVWINWQQPQGSVADGFIGGWPSVSTLQFDPEWEQRIPQYLALVGAFLKTRPELENQMPSGPDASGPWPSGRTWEMLARLLAAAHNSGISEKGRADLIMGTVGKGAGMEFSSWEQNVDLPDPEEILADPAKAAVPSRPDQTYAVIAAVAGAVLRNNSNERWSGALRYFARVAKEQKQLDTAAMGVRQIAAHAPSVDAEVPDEITILEPILREVGLMD